MVTAVGPRPTICWPGSSSGTGGGIARNTRGVWRGVLLLVLLAVGGCGDERASVAGTVTSPAPTTETAPPPAAPVEPAAPDADEPIPWSPGRLADRHAEVARMLRHDIEAWLAGDPGPRSRPPARVELEALYQQRVYRRLARHPRLARPAIRRMPSWLRGEARDSVAALRSLFALTSLATEARFRTAEPAPPERLRGFYLKAQRRFGVRWNVLAAVNFIESNFNRLRNVSSAGAVGPMQFIPSTWAAYGMGGDIRDPHDAIMGAANYLRASGAPGSYSRALFAYNRSQLYVRAVLRYARRMERDPRAYYAYWSWQSFMRTRRGDVQLTGPGADR